MRALAALAVAAALALSAGPARAVFSGDMSPRADSGDADYAAAIHARRAMDWEAMIGHLLKVVERRPWHDNAHTLLGYGYRHIGDFERAFHHYEAALAHNPRHRGALSYMAIAHLKQGDLAAARERLAELREICAGMALTFSDGAFGSGCEEYADLDGVIAYFVETGEVIDMCPDIGG